MYRAYEVLKKNYHPTCRLALPANRRIKIQIIERRVALVSFTECCRAVFIIENSTCAISRVRAGIIFSYRAASMPAAAALLPSKTINPIAIRYRAGFRIARWRGGHSFRLGSMRTAGLAHSALRRQLSSSFYFFLSRMQTEKNRLTPHSIA